MSDIKHDPIEDNPKFKKIVNDIEAETEKEVAKQGIKKELGYCHAFWAAKKRILKEKYSIEWKIPSEMNPDIMFD